MGFVHLHLHTQYSLLEGAIRVEDLFPKLKELGMDTVALTDTHNLFGAIDFYNSAKDAGVKPIIGCEILWAPGGRSSVNAQSAVPKVYRLVLLCKDLKGYQNLCQIVTRAYTEAPPPQKGQPAAYRSVVDRDLLEKYSEGLIVLSGGLRGEIPTLLLFGEEGEALSALQWFKKRFGEDFYLELQETGLPEQDRVNATLYEWSKRHEIEVVATANAHYLKPEDAEAHEVLQCIEHGKNLDFDRPKSLVPPEYYLKPESVMRAQFERFPEACDNTLKVAAKCDLKYRFKDEKGRPIYHLPDFRPDNVAPDQPFDLVAYFKQQARDGMAKRFAEPQFAKKLAAPGWSELEKSYHERLEAELTMIERTGFSGYFLIVSDFILWAKRNDIPVGPGRGSGAGSLVAYSLFITDLDPIEFNLLFERFINPERVSMPDFDVDFCQDRRGEVIDYVMRKYGADNVCQIITFGKLQARAALKDVGRVLGLTFAETDLLTKLMPDELGITIQDALEKEPRLREKQSQEPRMGKVIDYALALEGLYRNAGIHAAGVIITQNPVVEYAPLYVSKDGDRVVQFEKDSAEKVGLVKFDFLGLKTLTVIDQAVKLVRSVAEEGSPEKEFELARMDYNDPKVFALISSGDTDGIFQVESSGMKDLCSRIQPSSLEDITAINALYRPGPLGSGMVDDFIDRKHGRKPIVYDVDQLATILKDTYGVILYQEQVMQIARELAGYSLGQADLLRRAMGKKKPEEMAKHREIFVTGAVSKGLLAAKAEGIFDLMAKFAEYGFNKSHSAAYGVLTYQTAYLKTYFPAEFMAALMTTEMDATDKLTKYIADSRAHGIAVLPPDVNRSQRKFSVERVPAGPGAGSHQASVKAIRFGIEAIKGVGGAAVDTVLGARAEGPFKSVLDFCRRVSTRKANKKVLESLIVAGAFDEIAEANRASLLASVEGLIEFANDEQQERELGQNSLFDALGESELKAAVNPTALIKQEPDWPRSKQLVEEKRVVGFYVSGHPMDTWQKICEDWLGWSVEKVKLFAQEKAAARAIQAQKAAAAPEHDEFGGGRYMRPPKQEVRLGGLITEIREVMTKKGTRMAFGQFEDLRGRMEIVFFPDAYQQMAEIVKKAMAEAEPLITTAEVEFGDEAPKLLAKTLEWASEAHRGRVQQVILRLSPSHISADQLRDLKRSLLNHRGKCPVRIDFVDPHFRTRLDLPRNTGVAATPQLVESVNRIFGSSVVALT